MCWPRQDLEYLVPYHFCFILLALLSKPLPLSTSVLLRGDTASQPPTVSPDVSTERSKTNEHLTWKRVPPPSIEMTPVWPSYCYCTCIWLVFAIHRNKKVQGRGRQITTITSWWLLMSSCLPTFCGQLNFSCCSVTFGPKHLHFTTMQSVKEQPAPTHSYCIRLGARLWLIGILANRYKLVLISILSPNAHWTLLQICAWTYHMANKFRFFFFQVLRGMLTLLQLQWQVWTMKDILVR